MDRKIAALLAKPVWHAERKALRDILLGCGLTETVKWGNLCYTDSGANIVMIYALKAYCGLSFFKGALMNDPEKVLYQRSEQMQAARLMRFTGWPAISQARGRFLRLSQMLSRSRGRAARSRCRRRMRWSIRQNCKTVLLMMRSLRRHLRR